MLLLKLCLGKLCDSRYNLSLIGNPCNGSMQRLIAVTVPGTVDPDWLSAVFGAFVLSPRQ